MIPSGRPFYKMSGSGNDFVFVDAMKEPPGRLTEPIVVASICSRGTGIGADGIVFLEPADAAAVKLVYLNSDGSRAEFCGNATLCTTRLAAELGFGSPDGMIIETDSGPVSARIRSGQPEIDLPAVTEVHADDSAVFGLEHTAGEERVGFAIVGVPHIVILCRDAATVDVVGRGRPLRRHRAVPNGANVNFVSPSQNGDSWRIRTYERGVEAETLACGSGSVATAILLQAWKLATSSVRLVTSSGRILTVRTVDCDDSIMPSLAGEGRIVYSGTFGELDSL